MANYLIIKCVALNDQWECDAMRVPVCMTDKPEKYGMGYEIYELQKSNTFKRIKEYDTPNEEGMAVYHYVEKIEGPVEVFEKFPNLRNNELSYNFVKEIKNRYGFTAPVESIRENIHYDRAHAEEIKGKYIVFGEYYDDIYTSGY